MVHGMSMNESLVTIKVKRVVIISSIYPLDFIFQVYLLITDADHGLLSTNGYESGLLVLELGLTNFFPRRKAKKNRWR